MAEHIPAPKALNLDGNVAENWRRWKKAYELYMTATEKDKKSQKIQCATFLTLAGEAAITVYETLTFEETEKDKIEPLISKFEAFCMPKKNVTHERHVFNLRKQKPEESVEQFATELKRLAKNCEYGELTDSIIKDRIVEGINNDSTRAWLLREKDLSLQRCIEVCKSSEVAEEHMKTLTHESNKVRDIDAVKKNIRARDICEPVTNAMKIHGNTTDKHATDVVDGAIASKTVQLLEKNVENVIKNNFMSQCKTRIKDSKQYRKPRIDSLEHAGKYILYSDPCYSLFIVTTFQHVLRKILHLRYLQIIQNFTEHSRPPHLLPLFNMIFVI